MHPKLKLLIGVHVAVALLGLVPLFNWYFNTMSDAEHTRKVARLDRDDDGVADYLEERDRALAAAHRTIEQAPVSINSAMDQLASSGRNIPLVAPRRPDGLDSSITDALGCLGAIKGWTMREDEPARLAAEAAFLRRRALGVAQRLGRATSEATELKLDELASQSSGLQREVRVTATVATLTRAEEWLAAWPRQRALAPAPN